jgi:hypothetical protein
MSAGRPDVVESMKSSLTRESRRAKGMRRQPIGPPGGHKRSSKAYFGGVGRHLEPRESDLLQRARGRGLVGVAAMNGRSAFALTTQGMTKGIQEYEPKRSVPPLMPPASGSGKDGGELTAAEIVERRELDRRLSRVFTLEKGERAKAYEKAQRGAVTPGPGEYETSGALIGRDEDNVAVKYQEETRGFKTDLDWTILRAAQLPSAQEYGAYQDPRMSLPNGGRFNKGNSKSDIDWIIYQAKQLPSSAEYNVPGGMDNAREGKARGGSITSAQKEPYYVTQARRTQGQPGPGQYNDMASWKKSMDVVGGGRISATKVPSANDAAIKLAKGVPGPGAYDPVSKTVRPLN